MRRTLLIALTGSLSLSSIAAQTAHRPELTFVKVADTFTPVPGGVGTFGSFADARDFDGRTAVFNGTDGAAREGLYAFRNGALELLVNEDTLVPDAAQSFTIFFDVAVQGSMVAFTGGWPGGSSAGCQFSPNEGVFAVALGTQTPLTLADSDSSDFRCFHGVDLNSGQVVVTGGNDPVDVFHNHQESVLRIDGLHLLSSLVSTAQAVPGGGGATFAGFDQEVALRGGKLCVGNVVPNSIPPLSGIYLDDGVLRVVADGTTPVPGGTGTFQDLRGMNYDGREVAFRGTDANGFSGIYVGTGPGDLRVAVNRSTPVPGTPFNFLGFSNPMAYADGVLAFTGFWAGGGIGLFLWRRTPGQERGKVERVLVKGDTIDGNTVEQAFAYAGQLVGNRMLIRVIYQGFTESGLYVAKLPFPVLLR